MNQNKLPLPKPAPVVRANGDAVVELRQDGILVGELNFSAILGDWLRRLGWTSKQANLHSVK